MKQRIRSMRRTAGLLAVAVLALALPASAGAATWNQGGVATLQGPMTISVNGVQATCPNLKWTVSLNSGGASFFGVGYSGGTCAGGGVQIYPESTGVVTKDLAGNYQLTAGFTALASAPGAGGAFSGKFTVPWTNSTDGKTGSKVTFSNTLVGTNASGGQLRFTGTLSAMGNGGPLTVSG